MRFYVGHRLPGGFWGGFSTYARRPHYAARQAARKTGGIGCLGFVALAVVVGLAFEYWYVSVPVLVLTAIAVGVTVHRHHVQRAAAAHTAPTAATQPSFATPTPSVEPSHGVHVGQLVRIDNSGAGMSIVPATKADVAGGATLFRVAKGHGTDDITFEPVSLNS